MTEDHPRRLPPPTSAPYPLLPPYLQLTRLLASRGLYNGPYVRTYVSGDPVGPLWPVSPCRRELYLSHMQIHVARLPLLA